MNTNEPTAKELLIRMICSFSEEFCQRLFMAWQKRIGNFGLEIRHETDGDYFVFNWDESKHPRDERGRFASKDLGDVVIKKPSWADDGLASQVKRDLQHGDWKTNLVDLMDGWKGSPEDEKRYRERIRKRMTGLAKQYRDLEDTIDVFEEAYADRSATGDGVKLKWPDTTQGREDRKKYKKMLRKRARLEKMIDWKEVDEEELDKD